MWCSEGSKRNSRLQSLVFVQRVQEGRQPAHVAIATATVAEQPARVSFLLFPPPVFASGVCAVLDKKKVLLFLVQHFTIFFPIGFFRVTRQHTALTRDIRRLSRNDQTQPDRV
ncbi:hypothetical protein PHSY_003521 [Pseudozyma hubeiensis SY62]|uniref:Transmembrane protein n=1 Tax=Pseudozyma hubeiensis (strain SY62) TaxID=1305764 RepID=R9P3C9_PSEHS|nr:hypothetical protein PHSY_003521 [Pseudozyma hubeiensis SY62]GAC95943.1 hypothetical protein PHSY_003521 [Pseudozyma hubeiensis SY62]